MKQKKKKRKNMKNTLVRVTQIGMLEISILETACGSSSTSNSVPSILTVTIGILENKKRNGKKKKEKNQ
jgi:hypothetical protein